MGIESVESKAMQDFTLRLVSAVVSGIQCMASSCAWICVCAWMHAADVVHMEHKLGFLSLFY